MNFILIFASLFMATEKNSYEKAIKCSCTTLSQTFKVTKTVQILLPPQQNQLFNLAAIFLGSISMCTYYSWLYIGSARASACMW